MAKPGDVLHNPVTGQRLRILLTGEQTAGRLFRGDLTVPPGGSAGPRHLHPNQREDFEVLSGRAEFAVGDWKQVAGPGDRVEVPSGVPHGFRAIGDGELRLRLELRPAPPSTARFFELYFALGQARRMNRWGMPSPLDMARIWPEVAEHVMLAGPPARVQGAVFKALAPIGRLVRSARARRG